MRPNCRANSTNSTFLPLLVRLTLFYCSFLCFQFDYKRSNFSWSNITHSNTFFHISKFLHDWKSGPFTMRVCMFLRVKKTLMLFVCNSTFIFHLRCQYWHHWLIICYFRVLVDVFFVIYIVSKYRCRHALNSYSWRFLLAIISFWAGWTNETLTAKTAI